jgi:imidazolonepropionase-like amidohydrolase
MSLEQIFRAATVSNAREFKLESQTGTIEPGKVANLVLMTKNPSRAQNNFIAQLRSRPVR